MHQVTKSVWAILRPQIPFFLTAASFGLVCFNSNLVHGHLRLLIYAYAFLFTRLAHYVQFAIVASRKSFEPPLAAWVPALVFAANFIGPKPILHEVCALYGFFAITAASTRSDLLSV
jgi:hypothetical protein